MGIKNIGQQGIVFAVFAVLFAAFALFLPGFFTTANMLTLLQNVAVLGILGLAMAIVVIGRGIDISLDRGARGAARAGAADGAGRLFAADLAGGGVCADASRSA